MTTNQPRRILWQSRGCSSFWCTWCNFWKSICRCLILKTHTLKKYDPLVNSWCMGLTLCIQYETVQKTEEKIVDYYNRRFPFIVLETWIITFTTAWIIQSVQITNSNVPVKSLAFSWYSKRYVMFKFKALPPIPHIFSSTLSTL